MIVSVMQGSPFFDRWLSGGDPRSKPWLTLEQIREQMGAEWAAEYPDTSGQDNPALASPPPA